MMPIPRITGFEARAGLNNGLFGLNSKNNSRSPTIVTGDNLSDGLAVRITCNSIRWDGTLALAAGQYRSNVKCTNPGRESEQTPKKEEPENTEDVTVTVGSGGSTSQPFVTPVEVGPGPAP
jgi:hypothetical protein